MYKRVILVTGTPCVGKTTVAHLLTSKLNAFYVNLTELAIKEKLILGKDEERNSIIINEESMAQKILEIVKKCKKSDIIIDGHYAVHVVHEKIGTKVFVLRRNPIELKKILEQEGFIGGKLWENLASEILDVCLYEALSFYTKEKICEIDVSGKKVEKVVNEILEILNKSRRCYVGVVDWLGKLESEGLLAKFLKL